MNNPYPSSDTSEEIMLWVLDDILKKGKCVVKKDDEPTIEISYNDAGWYEVSRDGVVIAKSVSTTFLKSVLEDLVCPMIYRKTKQWISALGHPNLFDAFSL